VGASWPCCVSTYVAQTMMISDCTCIPVLDLTDHVLLCYREGEAEYDNFGASVSLSADGSVMAVGASHSDGINGIKSGGTRVFQFQAGSGWLQIGGNM